MPDDAAQIAAIIAGLNEHVKDTVVDITLDVTDELTEATPHDTGWAAANWIPTTGRPSGKPVGTDQNVSEAKAAQDQSKQDVAGYKLTDGKTVISNAVPYIGQLNDGSSRRAPAGFVQRAIQKALLLARFRR